MLAVADVSVLAAITWLASGLLEQMHAVPALSGASLATLFADFKILLKTVPAVLRMDGAH